MDTEERSKTLCQEVLGLPRLGIHHVPAQPMGKVRTITRGIYGTNVCGKASSLEPVVCPFTLYQYTRLTSRPSVYPSPQFQILSVTYRIAPVQLQQT